MAESIRNSITMFVNRLHDLNSNGSSITTDPVVLSLYQNLTAMQPQLLKQIDEIQQQKGTRGVQWGGIVGVGTVVEVGKECGWQGCTRYKGERYV